MVAESLTKKTPPSRSDIKRSVASCRDMAPKYQLKSKSKLHENNIEYYHLLCFGKLNIVIAKYIRTLCTRTFQFVVKTTNFNYYLKQLKECINKIFKSVF